MSTEVEISFNLNHPLLKNGMPTKGMVVQRLKKMGAKKVGTYLFQIIKFDPPNGSKEDTLRIRNEGRYVTLTYKHKDPKTKYKEEYEVIIDDFDRGIALLKALGLKVHYFYEKIREIWTYKNTEIVLDDVPGVPTIVEVECKSTSSSVKVCEKAVYNTLRKIGIRKKKDESEPTLRSKRFYEKIYGFILHDDSLPFAKAKSILGKKCTKNKTALMKILQQQMKLYKRLVKRKGRKSSVKK
jgi:predicted adenylyl cyclase CyaB